MRDESANVPCRGRECDGIVEGQLIRTVSTHESIASNHAVSTYPERLVDLLACVADLLAKTKQGREHQGQLTAFSAFEATQYMSIVKILGR